MLSPLMDQSTWEHAIVGVFRLEDEMYEKILSMEKVMQGEIDHLKQREMELIQCLQEDREKLVDEKNTLEKVIIYRKKIIIIIYRNYI